MHFLQFLKRIISNIDLYSNNKITFILVDEANVTKQVDTAQKCVVKCIVNGGSLFDMHPH